MVLAVFHDDLGQAPDLLMLPASGRKMLLEADGRALAACPGLRLDGGSGHIVHIFWNGQAFQSRSE
jgi:hypothetical protein